jgi:hypothetical protein
VSVEGYSRGHNSICSQLYTRTPELRFSATLGQELEVELAIV